MIGGRLVRSWGMGAVLSIVAGCREVRDTGGQLEARWAGAGADTGAIGGPAAAEWCAREKYVQVLAVRGDTGLAIVVASGDTIKPGPHTIVEPSRDSLRNGAALAMRWLEQTSVRGFQADKGTVVLRWEPEGTLSGEVDASGRLLGPGRRRLDLDATFRGVRVRRAATACALSVDSRDGDDLFQEGLRP